MYLWVREHIPLEQGLRPADSLPECEGESDVREHIPLEQGLRPLQNTNTQEFLLMVREHIPLEQGLRPKSLSIGGAITTCSQRAYSIRTRIKTRRRRAQQK